MATVVRRYLRLTIALAGINALVAGTTVFTLWSRSGSGSDAASMANLPAAQPKLSYPTPPPAPVASPTPSPAPVAPAPPAETVSPLPSPKPAASAPTPRPRRSVAKTQVAHRPVEDLKTVALDSVVERW